MISNITKMILTMVMFPLNIIYDAFRRVIEFCLGKHIYNQLSNNIMNDNKEDIRRCLRFSIMPEYPDAKMPERSTTGSVGFDLRSAVGGVIKARHRMRIPTGIRAQYPEYIYQGMVITYFGKIESRSGLALNNGIRVGAGIIDPDYTGEIAIVLFNDSDDDFEFEKHTRLAQMIIQPAALPIPIMVNDFEKSERGSGGFGSTGMK